MDPFVFGEPLWNEPVEELSDGRVGSFSLRLYTQALPVVTLTPNTFPSVTLTFQH
jgi:hypothetical protein